MMMKQKENVDMILLGHSTDRMTCHYEVSEFRHSMVVKAYLQYTQMN